MSAECDKHGTDLVYPEGSWPVGVCPVCEKDDELESLGRLYVACRDDYERLCAGLSAIAEQPTHGAGWVHWRQMARNVLADRDPYDSPAFREEDGK